MTRLRLPFLAAVTALAFTACATQSRPPTGAAAVPSPPGKEDCLWVRMMDDWSPVDRERLLLFGPGHTTYLATLAFPSSDIEWNWAIGIRDRDNDGRICGNGFDEVLVRGGMPDRIQIASVKLLSKEDAKAFIAAVHPKREKHDKSAVTRGDKPTP